MVRSSVRDADVVIRHATVADVSTVPPDTHTVTAVVEFDAESFVAPVTVVTALEMVSPFANHNDQSNV